MLCNEKTSEKTPEPILLAIVEEYSRLPEKKHDRYWQLRDKREVEPLTDAESNEYKTLIQEWEARNVERIRALIALAKKRGTTLRDIMLQLGVKGSENDL